MKKKVVFFVMCALLTFLFSTAVYAWSGVDASLSFSANYNVYCIESYQPGALWDGITNSTTEYGYFTTQTLILNTGKRAYNNTDALKSVAAHEFGHVFGLADYSASKTIMNDYTWGPNSRYETFGLTTPQNDDKNGVNYLY